MARYRTIKPEFWTSEQVMECSPITRLMFIGMWNYADDHGRIPLSPKTIKAQLFPNDPITAETIRGMIDELSSNGLVRPYVIDGKEYLLITGWHHQKIDKPQKPKYPDPTEHSPNIPRMVAPEREKGREGKEEDAASAAPASEEKQIYDLGKELLGSNSGGIIKKLIVAKDGVLPLARAALETSRVKSNPREYIGAIIRSRDGPVDNGRSF